jgi:S-adenosylmethionine/arginine decarboxylase-like enzyme
MIMDDSSGFDSLVQNSMAPSNGTAAEQIARPYEVRLPRKILAFTFLAICTTEYGVGRLCRSLLQRRLDPTFLQDSHWPDILIHNGVTRTIYSSKLFDAGQPGHTLFAKRTKKGETGETRNDEATTTLQPAGEHLLVDIDLLDSNFLGSPLMVSNAVIEILGCKSFTLLSYHCHNLRQGYACVGIMADLGHISLRTWPKYGVLSLDMFSSKEEDLFELIPIIEAIFAKYQINSPSKSAQLHWASKQRGFRHLQEDRNFAEVDVELMLLGSMNFEMKRNVAVVETQYQRVEIFDVVDERFRRSPAHYLIRDENSSYCIKHLELLRPDRILCKSRLVLLLSTMLCSANSMRVRT